MKRFLKGKNIVIGIITLVIGVAAVIGIARVWSLQTTTINGNVVSFIINPEGKVDGVILDSGDQVNFGTQTGGNRSETARKLEINRRLLYDKIKENNISD
ncbi:MAG TPA: helix-turn-helix domain-containing protein [Pyrinomonadaceae bacterium]|nr:helix-turn-helix domain-containing protein [Pyrinomonadaceae bacterium]